MVPTLVLFLFLSHAQAISSTSDFHIFGTSENRVSKQSNVQQTHEKFLLERLTYGSQKVEEREEEISEIIRKRGGGGGFKRGTYNAIPNRHHRSETSLLQVPLTLSVASLAFIFIFLCFN